MYSCEISKPSIEAARFADMQQIASWVEMLHEKCFYSVTQFVYIELQMLTVWQEVPLQKLSCSSPRFLE